MKFLDRIEEQDRLLRGFRSETGSFICLYGRRRCGKSRLLRETLSVGRAVYHVADQMEASLQRRRLAADIGRLLSGFDRVEYPDWSALLDRWREEAPAGASLILDEFPYLVISSPELPSILQRLVDSASGRRLHTVICGSSQRMMQGLVLAPSAPLYGRAREILKIKPLDFGWMAKAFPKAAARDVLEQFSVWGGVPRYWELAAEFKTVGEAIQRLILSPQGVLHNEPHHLLMDDMNDIVQASSVLTLVGQGCHRISEIAARLGKPATSIARPMAKLLELGLIVREIPFGADERGGKKSIYCLSDPFLSFWFRFVQPNRSLLESVPVPSVYRNIRPAFLQHTSEIWEMLARRSVPRMSIAGKEWGIARRWWGGGTISGQTMEMDVVAESTDRQALLVGEVKLSATAEDVPRIHRQLQRKVAELPFAKLYQRVETIVFAAEASGSKDDPMTVGISDLLKVLV